jgi:uncharacterized protein DUF3606
MISDEFSTLALMMHRMVEGGYMPDDKNNRGAQDRSRISLNQDYEVRYWTEALGVSRERLEELVRKYGNSAQKIREALKARFTQTRWTFFPTSMTCGERPRYDSSVHALKYALATLIQGVASALRHQLFEHTSHCFYSIH